MEQHLDDACEGLTRHRGGVHSRHSGMMVARFIHTNGAVACQGVVAVRRWVMVRRSTVWVCIGCTCHQSSGGGLDRTRSRLRHPR